MKNILHVIFPKLGNFIDFIFLHVYVQKVYKNLFPKFGNCREDRNGHFFHYLNQK